MKIEDFRLFKAGARLALIVALGCVTLLCVTPLSAQETGEILGTVTDSTGAVGRLRLDDPGTDVRQRYVCARDDGTG